MNKIIIDTKKISKEKLKWLLDFLIDNNIDYEITKD